MALGRFRGDKWAYLGLAMNLAVFIYGRRLPRLVDDFGLRFMLIVCEIVVLAAGFALMFFQGPGQAD
jgi:hypothetical protein